MPSGARFRTFECMTRPDARHRLAALATIALLVLAPSCGSDDDDGAAASADDVGDTATEGPEPAGSAPGTDTPPDDGTAAGTGCVLDEAAVGAAIGVEVIVVGDCDFAAGAAAGEAVTWSVELYVDPTVPAALEDGTPVAQLGDRATWNDGLGVLSVQAGERYFQVQPLQLGDSPVTLAPQELAQAVARLVLERA